MKWISELKNKKQTAKPGKNDLPEGGEE